LAGVCETTAKQPHPSSASKSAVSIRLFQSWLVTVDASGVDTEQDRNTVPSAAGDLQSGHASIQVQRHATVPQIVRPQGDPEAACQYAEQALDQLRPTWYATGMDRVLEVRKAMQQWAGHECVQRLDDHLYGWQTTLSALQH